MSSTYSNLSRGEEVIAKAEINKCASLPTTIVMTMIFTIIFFFLAIFPLSIVFSVLAFFLFYSIFTLPLKTTELILTNKKIIGKTGIINTKVMDSPLNKINNISVEQGLGGKIFGYGKIVITTAAGNYNFSYISQPDVFRSAVMNQIDVFDEERIRKQAEQLAGAMKQQ